MSRVAAIGSRLRAEFFTPDRGAEYSELLAFAQTRGFEIRSLESLWSSPESHSLSIAFRHDVDRPATRPAREIFLREQSAGARSTFYFRLKTFPPNERLVGRLLDAGFDVGYHYEEAADIAKELGLRSRRELDEHVEAILDRFRANVELVRDRYHPGLRSVASHGEWINARLSTANKEFVSDDLLAECGLWFEAYHPLFTTQSTYVSDATAPPEQWAKGYTVEAAIAAGHSRICVLTHPSRWFRATSVSASHFFQRGLQEARYRIRSGARSSSRRA
jgi:hypothetical protein